MCVESETRIICPRDKRNLVISVSSICTSSSTRLQHMFVQAHLSLAEKTTQLIEKDDKD